MPRFHDESFAGGSIRKSMEIEEDGFVEVTQWDPEPFLERNKVIRDLNTRVDTSGMAWHQAASIPLPLLEQWRNEWTLKHGQEEALRMMNDPKVLLDKVRERDFNRLAVSDKI